MADNLRTVAIIGGTGAEGTGLALRFAHAGYRIILGTRDPEKGAAVVAELNAILDGTSITCQRNKDAARAADIVILTVPYSAQRSAVEEIRDAIQGKILIDSTVPLIPPKVSQVQLPNQGSAVADIQAALGGTVRVVSAFQNVSAHKLRKIGASVDCDVLVCANDAGARATVIGLIEEIGLKGIDAGPICNSAAAEALTSILIGINRVYKLPGSGIKITGFEDRKQ